MEVDNDYVVKLIKPKYHSNDVDFMPWWPTEQTKN